MAADANIVPILSDALGASAIAGLRRLSGGASRDTWAFTADGAPRVVQIQRPDDERDMQIEADVVTAAGVAGVRVPELIVCGQGPDESTFMVLAAIEGETIARKIQRNAEFASARSVLVEQLGESLARIHSMSMVEGLRKSDPIEDYTTVLDELGEPHPMLELVRRWLLDHRPRSARTGVVHGDFRLGNLIVDGTGLRAVIDWELAHLGDPMEDLGWLCVKAWRFGRPRPVAGLGAYDDLFDAYEAAGGGPVDGDAVRWWEVLGTWKWAIMCIRQASVHLSGSVRSHELAAIGRRVCENEHDLFLALEGRW